MLGLLDIDPAAAAPIWRQIEDEVRLGMHVQSRKYYASSIAE